MYAVLIEVDVRGVPRDAGLQTLREQIIPSIKQLPGFRSGTWLPGNDDGKGLSLTVWDTEADDERVDRALRSARGRRRGLTTVTRAPMQAAQPA